MLRLHSVFSNPIIVYRSAAKRSSGIQSLRLINSPRYRSFSISMAPQQEWLVILPDVPGTEQKRKDIRPTHLKNVAPEVNSGKVLLGGATLAKPLKEGEAPQMTGSALITVADTKEDVLEFLKRDVYAESGVWDIKNVQIIPFRTAVRKSLPDLGTVA